LAAYVPADALATAKEAALAASSTDWASFLAPEILESARHALGSVVFNWPAMLSAGIFGGLGMGASAWFQGKAGAAASDAIADTGKGFGNYLMTIGIVETVALFVMVFLMINIT
jgi:V/A-type H+-transporting ATPase subunit K